MRNWMNNLKFGDFYDGLGVILAVARAYLFQLVFYPFLSNQTGQEWNPSVLVLYLNSPFFFVSHLFCTWIHDSSSRTTPPYSLTLRPPPTLPLTPTFHCHSCLCSPWLAVGSLSFTVFLDCDLHHTSQVNEKNQIRMRGSCPGKMGWYRFWTTRSWGWKIKIGLCSVFVLAGARVRLIGGENMRRVTEVFFLSSRVNFSLEGKKGLISAITW
jgi:hypothetical protein